ncbi:MAG TPA: hypothetical protein VHZ55_31990 [Bryobacteraceae bacterium]|nr:hypothetical protein [Bryobacteraceae bacterium]
MSRIVTLTSYHDTQPDYLMRLLLIEDEQEAALMIGKGLRQESHTVDIGADGRAAWRELFPGHTT